MTSNIESEAFVFDRPRQSAHLPRILFDDYHRVPIPRELVAAREPGRPRTNNYNALSELGIQDNPTNRVRLSVHQRTRLGQTSAKPLWRLQRYLPVCGASRAGRRSHGDRSSRGIGLETAAVVRSFRATVSPAIGSETA
jgi:hypothetical protein